MTLPARVFRDGQVRRGQFAERASLQWTFVQVLGFMVLRIALGAESGGDAN